LQNNAAEEERNVVPRWRSLAATADWALESSRSITDDLILPEQFADDLTKWRAGKSIEDAHDIFSAGLISGNRSLLWEGGLQLISNEDVVDGAVIDSVKRAIGKQPDFAEIRKKAYGLESNEEYLRFTVKMLKSRLSDEPRNFLAALEISRVYTLLGINHKAEKWIHVANHLGPNNRQVLRAAVQFYDLEDSIGTSLPMLWRSSTLAYDPLVQSAEIAAAELSGRGSRIAAKAKRDLRGLKAVEKKRSELALAVATAERRSGLAERKVFQFVASGIAHPTENAIAQAVWLGEHSNRAIQLRFPGLEIPEDAYEARAYMHLDARRYLMAVDSAISWHHDQPFQSHPLSFLCTVAAVYCDGLSGLVVGYADLIMSRHSADWNSVNSALLVYVSAGNQEKASSALQILSSLAKTKVAESFAKAGLGLYEYYFGDSEVGRISYIDAIEKAKEVGRTDLAFTAATFLLVAIAARGDASAFEIGQTVDVLDKLSARVPAVDKNEIIRLWDRAKELIANHCRNRAIPFSVENGSAVATGGFDMNSILDTIV